MASVNFASLNCRGLADVNKRRDVLNYLVEKKYSIIFLQDIHVTDQDVGISRAQWGGQAIASPYKPNSRGCDILFNNGFEYKVIKSKCDEYGNFTIVEIRTGDKDITLINIYGPNKDTPFFYKKLMTILDDFSQHNMIFGGDWNMQPDQDTVNYRNINNPKSREILNEIIDKYCLTDIWRLLHGGTKHYTWRQNKDIKQARLDFFLVSDNILSQIKKAHIKPGYRTYHSLICMEYKVAENIQGRGYFKFNNSLLRDAEYVSKVKNIILETLSDYTPLVYNKDQISSLPAQDIILTISDQLFLEKVIMNIRGYTISYASSKKKKRNLAERDIENKLN